MSVEYPLFMPWYGLLQVFLVAGIIVLILLIIEILIRQK